ncbi:MAG: UDP-N-acetylmuramate dehydrogenase [Propionibacteriaceae bacterium]|nr:UDP-N-acetylmuramate dehydrogenase [Propionibacteriaceae bacterium]
MELTLPSRVIPESLFLRDFTTTRVGGPANQVVVARTEAELINTVSTADALNTPVLVISGGSNMVIADQGFPGVAVVVATTGVTVSTDECIVFLNVAAGESWDGLVAATVEQGWSGLEMLSGIPGLVGAAPVQNIGAYGWEVSKVITEVRAFDRQTSTVVTLSPPDCQFDYRTSRIKQEADRYVVLSVELAVRVSDTSGPIEYADLARYLGVDMGATAPIRDVRQAVLEVRRTKGMVLDAADHDTWSSGSFFTNPIISTEQAAVLPAQAPRFPQANGGVKTSAAWLIDHAGFHKGFGEGAATLSTKHVLALTNRGTATAQDIITLARRIRAGVESAYGITLEPEPILIGLSL